MRDQQISLQALASRNYLAEAINTCYTLTFHPQSERDTLYILWAANQDDATLLKACHAIFGNRLYQLMEDTANELLSRLIRCFEIRVDQSNDESAALLSLIEALSLYGAMRRLQCMTKLPTTLRLPNLDSYVRRAQRYTRSIQAELTSRLAVP